MKFYFTDDELPEPYIDVLGFYGVGANEFHVLYRTDYGKWYRRRESARSMQPPDYWAELPSIKEVED